MLKLLTNVINVDVSLAVCIVLIMTVLHIKVVIGVLGQHGRHVQ